MPTAIRTHRRPTPIPPWAIPWMARIWWCGGRRCRRWGRTTGPWWWWTPPTGGFCRIVNQKLALLERVPAVFHHQAGDRGGRAERGRDYTGDERPAEPAEELRPHERAGAFEQLLFRADRRQAGVREGGALREADGAGRKGRAGTSRARMPGTLPAEEPKEGMGMMTSFGSGIYLTPLQLASMVSVFANGGTLYYLQYPRSARRGGELPAEGQAATRHRGRACRRSRRE